MSPKVVLYVVSIAAICFPLLCKLYPSGPSKIKEALKEQTSYIKRRMHHLAATLFPSVFLRSPTNGPRSVPHYLFADGLTHAHTVVPAFLGARTGEQITRRICSYRAFCKAAGEPFPHDSFEQRPNVNANVATELALSIKNATSEASATLAFINRVDHRLQNMNNMLPGNGNHKELGLAITRVLKDKDIQKKLGALHPVCFDQHVKVFHHEARNPETRRRREYHRIALHLNGRPSKIPLFYP